MEKIDYKKALRHLYSASPKKAEAREHVRLKKKTDFVDAVRFESFEEGRAAQILHIGPFEEEGPTIEKLHRFIEDSRFVRSGKHHEIYLSDIRRAAPEKWRTIIRQPFEQGRS